MTGQPKNAPQDSGSLCDALIQMKAIRGGQRFLVITYSENDGGADDKRDYASAKEAARAARDYVRGKDESAYDGALVYDRTRRIITRLYGSFPEFARPVCAQTGQTIQA